ncbi:GNAT family N-acetyltransferase [Dyadobacter arcticus]|uniref:RimJ/RimL family protein N-acetyltransferase n=1 Tax=Dyadobacter arcticus TaxID=1078754 RepID=A0ABX0UI46_9BACT|nr:GNAT family N-acetyltransferase [Dyadobacter arcticus]NIJ52699.1 RimJ/RimL family protein N-acetyltransferase [Dyadobacter arcticus]
MELKIIELNANKLNETYRSDNCQMLLKTYDEYYQEIGFHLPWVGYFVIKENQIVGTCGFTGQPKEGKVEIAYWTFEEYEGQGISSFSCRELLLLSQRFDPNILITAKTAPEHNASTKILQNNGFAFTEVVKDHEIGDAWLWTYEI